MNEIRKVLSSYVYIYIVSKEIDFHAKKIENLTYHLDRCKKPSDIAKLTCMIIGHAILLNILGEFLKEETV